MALPRDATSYCPPPQPLAPDYFHGRRLRHTVRPAGTRDWLLIYTLRGSGLYRFPGGAYRSRPHDVTLFRPGAPHDYQSAPGGGWDLLCAHFLPKPNWIPWLDWPELTPGCGLLSPADPALRRRCPRRLRETLSLSRTAPRPLDAALNAFEEVLLWLDAANPLRREGALDPRVRKAAAHLSLHYAAPFDEEALGRAAGLSPSRLRHLFTAQLGSGPRQFHERLRIDRARHLLALSRQSVAEIAGELGFENPFYFSLRFKRETGESPRAFRERTLNNRQAGTAARP